MRAVVAVLALGLAACGEQVTPPPASPPPSTATLAPAPAALWDAPNGAFEAVEPTVFGIIGGPTVWDALTPLGRAYEGGEGAPTLDVHVRTAGDNLIADVLRARLADDSIGSEHIRIEFRREPEGWFPTNAYLRRTCSRAADPEAWSVAPCP